MKTKLFLPFFLLMLTAFIGTAKPRKPGFYEIRIYHLQNNQQEVTVDNYLQNALLPALDRLGIRKVGVFKPIGNDTLQDKRIYVLIPYRSAGEFQRTPKRLDKDSQHRSEGAAYLNAPSDQIPYGRIETILLEAFPDMPEPSVPDLQNDPASRVYELRSYEGPTEKQFANKVHMFNQGGEIALFNRLGFNAVFYGSVLAGSRMPNLMYMTAHKDMAAREQNWKAFGADPEWKKLSGMDFYKNNVSKIDIVFLHPTHYSGF